MASIFPKPITSLPEANIPVEGAKGYISQGEDEQIIFMEFEKDVEIPEHSHDSQWEIVVAGKVDYYEGGVKHTYTKGDRFYIPKGTKHSAKVYAGYASVAFFNQKERYEKKKERFGLNLIVLADTSVSETHLGTVPVSFEVMD